MFEDLRNFAIIVFGIFVGSAIIIFAIVGSLNIMEALLNRTTCRIYQENVVLYEGPGYQVDCKSAGNATSCFIGKPVPFQTIVNRKIVDKDLKVICE